jgi:hypothetical protein
MDKNINMKIAILAVGTNKYRSLMLDLVESINKKFLNEFEKHFILFSDEDIFSEKLTNVFFNKIEHEKWPLNSLKRYSYFVDKKDLISQYDYVFYFDADLLVVENVNDFEFHDLFAVNHPQNLFTPNMWDIETNKNSTAYLDPTQIGNYVQGCFWGGIPSEVLKMCDTLYKNAKIDLDNDFIAKWFDESHLNHYFFHNKEKVNIVSSSFSYPESWRLNVPRLIIHRDKNHTEMRS